MKREDRPWSNSESISNDSILQSLEQRSSHIKSIVDGISDLIVQVTIALESEQAPRKTARIHSVLAEDPDTRKLNVTIGRLARRVDRDNDNQ